MALFFRRGGSPHFEGNLLVWDYTHPIFTAALVVFLLELIWQHAMSPRLKNAGKAFLYFPSPPNLLPNKR